jgi:hypothetical protein
VARLATVRLGGGDVQPTLERAQPSRWAAQAAGSLINGLALTQALVRIPQAPSCEELCLGDLHQVALSFRSKPPQNRRSVPDAPTSPTITWTRASGLGVMRIREIDTRSWLAGSMLIWEIAAK